MSTKNLRFKEKLTRKLTEKSIRLHTIEEVVLANIVKLRLLVLIRIYAVVNVSKLVRYTKIRIIKASRYKWRGRVGSQKYFNKRMVQEYVKYLVR